MTLYDLMDLCRAWQTQGDLLTKAFDLTSMARSITQEESFAARDFLEKVMEVATRSADDELVFEVDDLLEIVRHRWLLGVVTPTEPARASSLPQMFPSLTDSPSHPPAK
jgi:hypothetical protein